MVSLIGLIGSAIRTSQWGVSGELQSDSADGKGLTLSLTHQSDFEAFADFWASTDGGSKASTEGETYPAVDDSRRRLGPSPGGGGSRS